MLTCQLWIPFASCQLSFQLNTYSYFYLGQFQAIYPRTGSIVWWRILFQLFSYCEGLPRIGNYGINVLLLLCTLSHVTRLTTFFRELDRCFSSEIYNFRASPSLMPSIMLYACCSHRILLKSTLVEQVDKYKASCCSALYIYVNLQDRVVLRHNNDCLWSIWNRTTLPKKQYRWFKCLFEVIF